MEGEFSLLSSSRAFKFSWRLFSIDSQLSMQQNKNKECILVCRLPVPQEPTAKKRSVDISFQVA